MNYLSKIFCLDSCRFNDNQDRFDANETKVRKNKEPGTVTGPLKEPLKTIYNPEKSEELTKPIKQIHNNYMIFVNNVDESPSSINPRIELNSEDLSKSNQVLHSDAGAFVPEYNSLMNSSNIEIPDQKSSFYSENKSFLDSPFQPEEVNSGKQSCLSSIKHPIENSNSKAKYEPENDGYRVSKFFIINQGKEKDSVKEVPENNQPDKMSGLLPQQENSQEDPLTNNNTESKILPINKNTDLEKKLPTSSILSEKENEEENQLKFPSSLSSIENLSEKSESSNPFDDKTDEEYHSLSTISDDDVFYDCLSRDQIKEIKNEIKEINSEIQELEKIKKERKGLFACSFAGFGFEILSAFSLHHYAKQNPGKDSSYPLISSIFCALACVAYAGYEGKEIYQLNRKIKELNQEKQAIEKQLSNNNPLEG